MALPSQPLLSVGIPAWPPCWAEMMFSEPRAICTMPPHLPLLPLCTSLWAPGSCSPSSAVCCWGRSPNRLDHWETSLGEKNDMFPWIVTASLFLKSPWTCYARESVTPTRLPIHPPTLPPTYPYYPPTHPPAQQPTLPPTHHPSICPPTCPSPHTSTLPPFRPRLHPLFKKGREFPTFSSHDSEQPVSMAELFLLFPSPLKITSFLIPVWYKVPLH